jgi:hypothetical protein
MNQHNTCILGHSTEQAQVALISFKVPQLMQIMRLLSSSCVSFVPPCTLPPTSSEVGFMLSAACWAPVSLLPWPQMTTFVCSSTVLQTC